MGWFTKAEAGESSPLPGGRPEEYEEPGYPMKIVGKAPYACGSEGSPHCFCGAFRLANGEGFEAYARKMTVKRGKVVLRRVSEKAPRCLEQGAVDIVKALREHYPPT